MYDLWAAQVVVCRIAVTLEYALEVAQEPFGTFPFPAHPKIEHYPSTRPAVLPEVGLVISASHPLALDSDRGFIGLDVASGQQLFSHCPSDGPEQFANPHHPTI